MSPVVSFLLLSSFIPHPPRTSRPVAKGLLSRSISLSLSLVSVYKRDHKLEQEAFQIWSFSLESEVKAYNQTKIKPYIYILYKTQNMTRTNKWTVHESKATPKYFTHTGNYGEAPSNVKKQGSGKGNWGKPGDEINDLIDAGEIAPIFNKPRRGSNSQRLENRLNLVQNEDR